MGSDRRVPSRRRITQYLAALTVLGLAGLTTPTTASAAATCSFNGGVLDIDVSGPNNGAQARVVLNAAQTQILVFDASSSGGNQVACTGGTATPTTTSSIQMDAVSADHAFFGIDLTNGAFAPGLEDEPGESEEIEFTLNGNTTAALYVTGGSGDENVTLGSLAVGRGVNLNANELGSADIDVTANAVTGFVGTGNNGNDTFNAAGPGGLYTGPWRVGTEARLFGDNDNDVLAAGGPETTTGWQLDGAAGNDTLTGGSGADRISPWVGNDVVDGNGGTDLLAYRFLDPALRIDLRTAAQQDTLGAGLDTISDIENVAGGDGNDILIGDGADNLLDGGEVEPNGNDTLMGLGGNDTLIGRDGVDTASYAEDGAAVTVNLSTSIAQNTLGSGMDTIVDGNDAGPEPDIENLIGSPFGDSLVGNAFVNRIEGGGGIDGMIGRGAADALIGGAPSNTVVGDTAIYTDHAAASPVTATIGTASGNGTVGGMDDAGDDLSSGIEGIAGGGGADILTGDGGPNSLDGLTGDDDLFGLGGNDLVNGGDGDDDLHGGFGADTLIGGNHGAFGDTVLYNDRVDAITATIGTTTANGDTSPGTGTDDDGTGDSISSSVENVFGGGNDDVLTGNAQNNRLAGFNGNDTFEGLGGDDVLLGGSGDDFVSYDNAPAGVTVDLRVAGPQPTGSQGADDISSVDHLYGSPFADRLQGNDNANLINPGLGSDTALLHGGPDNIQAQDGVPDSIDCGAGADIGSADGPAFETSIVDCDGGLAFFDADGPATVIDSGPSGVTTSATPSFTFSGEVGATFECRFDDGAFAPCDDATGPAGAHAAPLALIDGAHAFEVRATDAFRNQGPAATRAFTVDTSAPPPAADTDPPETTITKAKRRGRKVTLTFSVDEPVIAVLCRVDAKPFKVCALPAVFKNLKPGRHTFQVAAIDFAGNFDPTPAVKRVRVPAPG